VIAAAAVCPPPPLKSAQAAETGSGKTGAFALPVLQIVHETLRARARAASAAAGGSDGLRAAAACALSLDDRDAYLAVTPDGLRCQSRAEKSWGGGRATVGAFAGAVYYEATVTDEGLCRVGWSTAAASLDVGTDRHSFGYGGTGKKSHARSFEDYGGPYGRGDVVGCSLDCAAGTLAFSRNGAPLGVAYALPAHLRGQALYPAVCLKNAELALNFGAPGGPPFAFGPPPGFVGLAAAPRDQTTTPAGARVARARARASAAARRGACAGRSRAAACPDSAVSPTPRNLCITPRRRDGGGRARRRRRRAPPAVHHS
jgi:ATP-dependent RNA helicase DDX1